MSGLPETFPCPWCGMTYPAKPVLVGKNVRCKGCRNAFTLQADGIATKNAPEAPPPAPVPVPRPVPAPVPVPRPAPITIPTPRPLPVQATAEDPEADALQVSIPVPAPDPRSRPTSERNQRQKSGFLEAARAKMAADLAEVATKAANSEVAKREERRSERLTKAGASGKASEDAKRSKHTAILTGEGERKQRELRQWVIGTLVAIAVMTLIVLLFSMRSATRAALEAYAAAVPQASNRYPELGISIQSRAWLVGGPGLGAGPLMANDLSDARFDTERIIEVAPAATWLAELKGLRFAEDLGWWVAPADRSKFAAAVADRPAKEWRRLLASNKIRAVEHAAWLKSCSLPEDASRVLVELVAGRPSPNGIDFAKRMLDAGELPERIRLRPFSGKRGEMRVDVGPPRYAFKFMAYSGILARFEGAGWSTGWRVLKLQARP